MFILNPSQYLLPSYRISPFTTENIGRNHILPDDESIDYYFSERFKGGKYTYTFNGREAIHLALGNYNLQINDIVTIFTTTGNYYISGCVTKEIEKYCKWSRVIEPNTKVLVVNHEFGYPYDQLKELKKYKLPIIEDCAHSFFSEDKNHIIGTVGDFAIYSFPKIFPIQIGGLLVSNHDCELPQTKLLGKAEKHYIKNVLSYYIQTKDEIIEKRLNNYAYLSQEFKKMGLVERLEIKNGIVPGVFMFRKGKHQIELPELKKYFSAHGIQCSVFYGEDSFFIPVHQTLNKQDLSYYVEVMKSFIGKTVS